MKIAIWLSTLGGSPLQVGLERGLSQIGHHVETWRRRNEPYDLVLMFCQSAHNPEYTYPDEPCRLQPIVFVDSSEYGWWLHRADVAAPYKNAFSPGSMAYNLKNREEQTRLKRFLEGRSFPYFIREKFKEMTWPDSYHPIDYPLYRDSECHIAPTFDDYINRPMDLFVSWGLSHPWRNNLTAEMREMTGIKSEILVLGENGTPRMPHQDFFRKTLEARCSVSFDGFGSSSFRLTEVLCRSTLLYGPVAIERYKELVDGETCVAYQITSSDKDHEEAAQGANYVSSNLQEKIREVIDDPERSYFIYNAGFHWCHDWYSERATAKYVLDVVEMHDWSKPTPIDL